MPKVIIPARPGITNAIGCVVADVRHDYVNTINAPLDTLDMDRVEATLLHQVAEGRKTIERERIAVEELAYVYAAEMQFQGQSHILSIPLPGPDVTRAQMRQLFEEAYFARFAVELPEIGAVLVNLHTAVIGRRASIELASLAAVNGAGTGAPVATRGVWYESGWAETPIWRREDLPPGTRLEGPAIVEQLDTTIVIEPDCTAEADAAGNLIVSVAPAGGGT